MTTFLWNCNVYIYQIYTERKKPKISEKQNKIIAGLIDDVVFVDVHSYGIRIVRLPARLPSSFIVIRCF